MVSLQTHGCFCPDLRNFDLGLHLASVLLASFLMIGESIIVYFNYEIYCFIMMVMVTFNYGFVPNMVVSRQQHQAAAKNVCF